MLGSKDARRTLPTLMTAPAPSPINIQNHLYTSFLEGRTADVALRIVGSWSAVYYLHRVVLIQSVSRANLLRACHHADLTIFKGLL
jgi:hypothetical protein